MLQQLRLSQARINDQESQLQQVAHDMSSVQASLQSYDSNLVEQADSAQAKQHTVRVAAEKARKARDSVYHRISEERKAKHKCSAIAKASSNLIAIWQEVIQAYTEHETLVKALDLIQGQELEATEPTAAVFSAESVILEDIEREKHEISVLTNGITQQYERIERIKKKQQEVSEQMTAALHISPELYSPTNPQPLGIRNKKEILRDLRHRKRHRLEAAQQLRNVIANHAVRVTELQARLAAKAAKLTRRREDVAETEICASLEASFELNARQRFFMRCVISTMRSIRRELTYWSGSESVLQASSLLDSWRICLDSMLEDAKHGTVS
jgi:chromosome segregation ATPase